MVISDKINKFTQYIFIASASQSLISGKRKVKMKSLSHVGLFATPWTVAYQTPLSMDFSRQEYWNGLPFPSPFEEVIKVKYGYINGP